MALNHKLYGSQYLIEAYAEASKHWDVYMQSKLLEDDEMPLLRQVAETLCIAHTHLRDDSNFWAALIDLPHDLENNHREVEQTLDDLYGFLLQEEVFLQSLMNASMAKKLSQNS